MGWSGESNPPRPGHNRARSPEQLHQEVACEPPPHMAQERAMRRQGAALKSCPVVKERSRSRDFDGWETRIRTWIDGVRDRGPALGRPPMLSRSDLVFAHAGSPDRAHFSRSSSAAAEQSSAVVPKGSVTRVSRWTTSVAPETSCHAALLWCVILPKTSKAAEVFTWAAFARNDSEKPPYSGPSNWMLSALRGRDCPACSFAHSRAAGATQDIGPKELWPNEFMVLDSV
jgi:hypothetical protein